MKKDQNNHVSLSSNLTDRTHWFLKMACVFLGILAFLLPSKVLAQKEKSPKPNILFILADDLIFDGIGAYGRNDIFTPNIDEVAAKGIRFTSYYNTTAICMASRAQLMTGMYEFTTGCNFDRGNLPYALWQQSYPEILRRAGYITGFAGKFGFKVDEPKGKASVETVKRSFDWWCGWLGQGKYNISQNKDAEEYFRLYGDKSEHTTYALGEMGKEFIRKYAGEEQPFCLSISFKAPHTPYITDSRYDSIYANHKFQVPANFGGSDKLPSQVKAGRPFLKGKAWIKDYQGKMKKYHQMVYGMDVAIGMIIQELKEQKVDDHTVIIITSDNGHMNGVKDCSGKLYPYEEGSLAPLIIYNPLGKNQPGKILSPIAANIDIAPTIIDLAHAEIPANIQGESLVSLLKGERKSIHKSILLMNVWGARAAQSVSVVTPGWKYIYWFYGTEGYQPAEELYDREDDRLELHNLSGEKNYSNEMKEMQGIYDKWMIYWDDHCRENSDYVIYPQLARRDACFEKIDSSIILKMGKGLTEQDRK